MSRGGLKIQRVEADPSQYDRGDDDTWLNRVADQLERNGKTAVEVARERNEDIVQQIYQIMNGQPKKSVEEVVANYQEQIGLKEYQKKLMAEEIMQESKTAKKKEESAEKKTPEILTQYPSIANYIENLLNANPYAQVPGIIQNILEMYGRKGVRPSDVETRDFIHYVNERIMAHRPTEVDELDYENLGRGVGTRMEYDVNDTNRDPFLNLMPNRYIG